MATQNAVGTSLKQAFVTSLTESATSDLEGVGTLRIDQDGNVFRWVYNEDGVTMALGQIAFHTLTNTSVILEKVDMCASANYGAMAGVVMATSGIATLNWGWIQVLGYCTTAYVINDDTVAIATGDYVKGVQTATYGARDAATQPAYLRNLQILEAYATAGTPAAAAKKVLVNCL